MRTNPRGNNSDKLASTIVSLCGKFLSFDLFRNKQNHLVRLKVKYFKLIHVHVIQFRYTMLSLIMFVVVCVTK